MATSNHTHASHVTPLRVYLGVGAALIVLTAVTVAVSFVDLGGWNAVVAVAIAALKASLVALFFMHLLYDRKIFLVIFLIGVIFLAILIAFTMFDVLRRADIDPQQAEPIKREAVIYDRTEADSATAADTLAPAPDMPGR